jgi:two-component system, NtrC family, sensor histidine kinase HydH
MKNQHSLVSRIDEAIILVFVVIMITLLHYSTISNESILLHEISQRLYYIPIVYSAYRFGLTGSLLFSLLSGIIYLLHIAQHQTSSATTILNQYAEVIMFLAVGVATGFFADAERQQRQRFEKASEELAKAYQELRNTVDLLVRSARLKSLGELAATIAHEIRNPLNSIKGSIEIVSEEIAPNSPRREFILIMEKEVERLNNLVEDFLKFAKPRPPEKVATNVNEIIDSVVKFLSPQAKKRNVKLDIQLASELPSIPLDPEQIRQVLLNLILNAIQSMPEGGNVELSSSIAKDYLEISIRDYGTGISSDNQQKIFEPFFTTKTDGSGLGLFVAYQLVKQHNGEIEVANTSENGSLFVIKLSLDQQIEHNN